MCSAGSEFSSYAWDRTRSYFEVKRVPDPPILQHMPNTLDIETLDLAELASSLEQSLGARVAGAIAGRTAIRDALVSKLDCSELEAELLVDTLIARRFVVQQRQADGRVAWLLSAE